MSPEEAAGRSEEQLCWESWDCSSRRISEAYSLQGPPTNTLQTLIRDRTSSEICVPGGDLEARKHLLGLNVVKMKHLKNAAG